MKKIIFLSILIAIFYIGCGSDSPTGTNNPPPVTNDSALYSLDSITVLSDSTFIAIEAGVMIDTCQFVTVKVTYTSSTNCTDTNVYSFIQFGINNVYQTYRSKNGSSVNETVNQTFTLNTTTPYKFGGFVGIGFHNSQADKWVKLKNLKIYKVITAP